ncbi:MAG TPA: sigma-70 family RNA polymerase sigma factor [Noviherbaspirillum sp.]|nr:sigma-70 family RNA polymerase sigma factor [Noviherbaspirillum sp.]
MDLTRHTQPVELDRTTDLAPLWTEFLVNACMSARERIIDFYLPFARVLAAKLYAKRTYAELEFLDYFQFASIGLLEAVDRYDPAHGAKFETFAALRINGAILNGIASLSEKQEQISAKQRIAADRLKSLKEKPEKPKDPGALFGYLAELAIGIAVGLALEDSGMYRAEDEAYPDNTYRSVELKQLQQRMRELLEHLPRNERRVIKYHYLQQLAFEEIARILGVTKGRVSQIHKDALNRLRESVQRGGGIDLRC